MRRLMVLAVLMVFVSSFAFAIDTPKEGRIMIKGLRPMGMGGAFVAISDDENAVFYNPAGITSRQSWLLQILTIGATVNTETIKLASDAMDLANDNSDDSTGGSSNDGMSIDDISKLKDKFSNKDVDIQLLIPINLLFISSPIDVGKNSLSFGIGEYIYFDLGFNATIEIPQYIIELAKLTETGKEIEPKDIVSKLPVSMLQILGANTLTPDEIVQYAKDGRFKEIADDLIAGGGLGKDIIEALEKGGDLDKVITTIQDTLKDSLSDLSISAPVNVYATGVVDFPLAYRIKSLEEVHLPGELSVGVNFKYIQRVKATKMVHMDASQVAELEKNVEDAITLSVMHGQGFGIDIGTIYHYNDKLNFGLQIADLYTKINYDNVLAKYPETDPDSNFTHTATIESEVNIGVSFVPENFYYWKDKSFKTNNRFTFAADIRDLTGNYETGFQDRLHLGGEYRFSPFALRLGLNKLSPSFGLGLEFSWFQIMYAFYGDKSYLAKALGIDKTVYYHEFLIAVKLGHHDGKPFGSDVKNPKEKLTKEEKKAQKEQIKEAKAADRAEKEAQKKQVAEEKAAAKAVKTQERAANQPSSQVPTKEKAVKAVRDPKPQLTAEEKEAIKAEKEEAKAAKAAERKQKLKEQQERRAAAKVK